MHIHSAHQTMFAHLNILVRWGGGRGDEEKEGGKTKKRGKKGKYCDED